MNLAIIIVNWNTRDLIIQCLNSIYDNQPRCPFEIWVVDNGSIDGSVDKIRHLFPEVHLIQNHENIGFAAANNQGLQATQGYDCLLLNSDTIINHGALEGIIECANTYPDVGAIGCKLLNVDGSLQKSWAKFPNLWSEIMGIHVRERTLVFDHPLTYEVDWLSGACLFIRRKTIDEVGLLDETFFMYSEEVDWCYRIKQHNWKVYYLAETEITHLGGGSAERASASQLIALNKGKILLFRKFHGKPATTFLRWGLIVKSAVGYIRRIMIWPFHLNSYNEILNRLNAQWILIRWLYRYSP